MSTEPTHHSTDEQSIIFDPAALTLAQRDGRACVVCRIDVAPMIPVGVVDGAQVFACTSHDIDDQGDDEQGECSVDTPDDAAAGKSATWPDGEPQGVRDMARRLDIARRADRLAAQLERDFANVRDERLAEAVRATIEGLRVLSAACPTADEDAILRAAEHAHTALGHVADLVVEIERGDA
ncbi:hypothetical protein ACGFJT_24515 [Actinomadura geliboluensis]|uniref:hypothetical protein n=1 Tax=Actinomadura geliboluensis TaxID=882440 RepID=UPI0037106D8C